MQKKEERDLVDRLKVKIGLWEVAIREMGRLGDVEVNPEAGQPVSLLWSPLVTSGWVDCSAPSLSCWLMSGFLLGWWLRVVLGRFRRV